MTLDALWPPTGVILGFQMTLFSWRLSEEKKVGEKGDIPWLTPSDYTNLSGMLIFVFGVYLLPILGIITTNTSKIFFGLGVFLFIAQAMGTAGHYQLFNRTGHRKFIWFPKQEKVALSIFLIISIIYLIMAFIKL
jgi:hypothetical protein